MASFLPSEAVSVGAYTLRITMDPFAVFKSSFMRHSELDVGTLINAVRLLQYKWCSSAVFPYQKIVYSA